MFEIVKCLRDKSNPSASTSVEAAKPEEVRLHVDYRFTSITVTSRLVEDKVFQSSSQFFSHPNLLGYSRVLRTKRKLSVKGKRRRPNSTGRR